MRSTFAAWRPHCLTENAMFYLYRNRGWSWQRARSDGGAEGSRRIIWLPAASGMACVQCGDWIRRWAIAMRAPAAPQSTLGGTMPLRAQNRFPVCQVAGCVLHHCRRQSPRQRRRHHQRPGCVVTLTKSRPAALRRIAGTPSPRAARRGDADRGSLARSWRARGAPHGACRRRAG